MLRKLCSTLVAYFLRFPLLWERCVRHLVSSFYRGDLASLETLDQLAPTAELVTRLEQRQTVTLLWFCSTLVEDVGKVDSKSMEQ